MDKLCKKYNKKDVISGILIAITLVIPKFFRNIEYIFINGNDFDLRRENIIIHHIYHNTILNKYNIIDYKLGHYTENGKDAYVIKNPMWKITENN